jgi:metal-responsive CopG/Arc/MetJ family transcriptional regulator
MKQIVTASDLFKEDEYEIIFLPESLCEEVDEAITQTKSYNDRDEFVSSAVDKFISDVSEEKIQTTKHMLKD